VTHWHCGATPNEHTIPIGHPIANVNVYILDEQLELTPVGLVGELYIGGVAPARGYINNPSATAQSFVPDPFGSIPGARLYRTGDLARYQTDGAIEFLGRADQQVKLAGNRIELAEVEYYIRSQQGVRDAVVLVSDDSLGGKRLCAYVTFYLGEEIAPPALRKRLRDQLPSYMVPPLIFVLPEIPLLPNGKVDRAALHATEPHIQPEEISESCATGSDIQEGLRSIWARTLQDVNVRPSTNFFSAGGTSLSAVVAVSRVFEDLGRRLPVTSIFQYPTLREFTGAVLRARPNTRRRKIARLYKGAGKRPTVIVFHPIGGQLLCYRPLADRVRDSMDVIGLQLSGKHTAGRSLFTVNSLARDYAALITKMRLAQPPILLGWSFGALLAIEVARQLSASKKEVRGLILLDPPLSTSAKSDASPECVVENFVMDLGIGTSEELLDAVSAVLGRQSLDAARWNLEIHPVYLQEIVWAVANSLRALSSYNAPPFLGSATVFTSKSMRGDIKEASYGELKTFFVDAEHNQMLREPYVAAVARVLTELGTREG
ncbi:alpha/beta fold hydrolase, partial [Mesorhizobium sp.]|uniref:alpha/beta fold hydrolase n=1 Tax=Mesorhizobium sp. TaxID=1871066 RepID=UPI00120389D5